MHDVCADHLYQTDRRKLSTHAHIYCHTYCHTNYKTWYPNMNDKFKVLMTLYFLSHSYIAVIYVAIAVYLDIGYCQEADSLVPCSLPAVSL